MLFEQLNPHACQTYLVADEDTREALLVDPVLEHVDEYLHLLSDKQLRLRWVIDTHTHADHISGGPALSDRADCHYVMHRAAPAGCVTMRVEDGYRLTVGSLSVIFLHTPGHSPDSVCLLLPDRILTGDTLLIDSDGVGRDDLPGGSEVDHWHSLQCISGLPDHLWVYPSHCYSQRQSTTLGELKQGNLFLQQPDINGYRRLLESTQGQTGHLLTIQQANYSCAGDPYSDWIPLDLPACPLRQPVGINDQPVATITPQEIKRKLDSGWQGLILDVREAEELIGPLGHLPGIRHIPLGQLPRRLPEIGEHLSGEITVVCRTNPRAFTAAQILRQAGFHHVVVIEGGMVQWQVLGYPALYTLPV